MTILFGHPTGNPNSHHAALAHLESGRLESLCVPWMPTRAVLSILEHLPGVGGMARRLARRHFAPLAGAPKTQGRLPEIRRLLTRAAGAGDEGLSYEANDWLMDTMRRECRRTAVTAVHAYEDCSLLQFEEAHRLGKACIYDMPIGYYPAWEQTQATLARRYVDWLPSGGLPSRLHVRPQQKLAEMKLADLVLAPSTFVSRTVLDHHPDKTVRLAPYGVDLEAWSPGDFQAERKDEITFLFAGQISLRKGIPMLLEAWEAAGLRNARLALVGKWQLSSEKLAALPRHVSWTPPCSAEALLQHYRASNVFVFPSYFEGFGLVLLEAMASGMPAIASTATAGPDVIVPDCGLQVPVGDVDALVASLRWFDQHRERIPEMGRAARRQAALCTWQNYRRCVSEAVAPYV